MNLKASFVVSVHRSGRETPPSQQGCWGRCSQAVKPSYSQKVGKGLLHKWLICSICFSKKPSVRAL